MIFRGVFRVYYEGIHMTTLNIRLDATMLETLRAQAQSRGLRLAEHIRSQLSVTLDRPHNILAVREAAR